jgi:hypothetical protein
VTPVKLFETLPDRLRLLGPPPHKVEVARTVSCDGPSNQKLDTSWAIAFRDQRSTSPYDLLHDTVSSLYRFLEAAFPSLIPIWVTVRGEV